MNDIDPNLKRRLADVAPARREDDAPVNDTGLTCHDAPPPPAEAPYLCTTCGSAGTAPGAHRSAGCGGTMVADHAAARVSVARRAARREAERVSGIHTPMPPAEWRGTVDEWDTFRASMLAGFVAMVESAIVAEIGTDAVLRDIRTAWIDGHVWVELISAGQTIGHLLLRPGMAPEADTYEIVVAGTSYGWHTCNPAYGLSDLGWQARALFAAAEDARWSAYRLRQCARLHAHTERVRDIANCRSADVHARMLTDVRDTRATLADIYAR